MVFSIESNPQGPRLRVAGQRVHHGAVGIVAAAILAKKRPAVASAMLLLAVEDRHDWRYWFALGDGQRRAEARLTKLA